MKNLQDSIGFAFSNPVSLKVYSSLGQSYGLNYVPQKDVVNFWPPVPEHETIWNKVFANAVRMRWSHTELERANMPGGLIGRRKFRNIRGYTAGECHLTTDAKIDALQLQGKTALGYGSRQNQGWVLPQRLHQGHGLVGAFISDFQPPKP